ncbi:MAG: hypothetical protein HKN62_18065 [Phycisphaerales bacterium]|nr:hypothetical protein [Phycisphaerales bacterium]
MPRLARFRIAAIEDLHRQLHFAPPATRLRQMNAAETLLPDIEPDRSYPHDFVVFRITGYRPESSGASPMLVGQALRGDLATFVQALSADLELPPDFDDREAITLEAVARELRLSVKTLQRYRRDGLVCHYIREPGGIRRLVCFRDALDRFVAEHPDRIERAAAFDRVDPTTQGRIIEAAAALRATEDCSLNEAARRLAVSHDRAHETVRNLLQRHDRRAVTPIFGDPGPLTARDARVIERANRRGVSVARLATRFGCTGATVHRSLVRSRAQRLRGLTLRWIELPTFDRPDAESVLLSAPIVRSGLDRRLPSTDAHALLTAAAAAGVPDAGAVAALHGAYNFLKRRAAHAIETLPRWPAAGKIDAIETDLRWAAHLQRRLVSLGLPAAIGRIQQNLHQPLLARPAEEIEELLRFAVDVLVTVVEELDPSRDQRLERRGAYTMDRALAEDRPGTDRRGRARARHEPGSVSLPALLDGLTPWSGWLEIATETQTMLDRLDPADRELLRLEHGLDGEPPRTRTWLAEHTGTTVGSVTRRLHAAMRRLRRVSRG